MSHTISNITKTLFLATATLLALGVHAATPDEIMTKSNCMACHSKDKKVLGPSFKDIAAKYKSQDEAALSYILRLVRQIRSSPEISLSLSLDPA